MHGNFPGVAQVGDSYEVVDRWLTGGAWTTPTRRRLTMTT